MIKRSIVVKVGALLGAIALWSVVWALREGRLPEAPLIAPMLPQSVGQSACFTGSFAGQVMDVEDWAKPRYEPTGKRSPDGDPYMRPVPAAQKDVAVRAFTLQLTYDDRQAHYDWIYNFRLAAELEGVGTLFAAGECPWYAGEKKDKHGGEPTSANTIGLYIDCDGGGFDFHRLPAASAALVSFDPRIGLRMKKGCGGGGSYRIKPAGSGVAFRLQPAAAEACQPLQRWVAQ
jgi:hypothetical protein